MIKQLTQRYILTIETERYIYALGKEIRARARYLSDAFAVINSRP